MSKHVQLRLHDGFASVTRVVARLHALGLAVDEVHVRAGVMSVHLANDADAGRVCAVLGRLPDADVLTCIAPPTRTRYVVWSEPSRLRSPEGHV